MAPKKLEKKLRKEEKVKRAITIEKKKEIVKKKDRATNICKEDPPRQRKSQSLHSLG